MKTFYSAMRFLMYVLTPLMINTVQGQTGVFNQNDPIVIYDSTHKPTIPPWGQVAKWVKTTRMTWNADSYKCYFYKGYAFRLKYPKTYQQGVADGKTYPIFVFFHGKGEKGTIYDNEYQLYHGGQLHMNAVNNGQFDGYLLYLQSQYDGWSSTAYDVISDLIQKYFVPECKVDPFRVYADGLSSGGGATWTFLKTYPTLVAACLPISATTLSDTNYIPSFKFTPIWHFQGGTDVAPTPATSRKLGAAILAAGGNYRYTEYPNVGHGCWYNAWAEPDYFPFMLRANKVNPWPLYGKTNFSSPDSINVTMGVTAGFDGYQWRKDGVVITGASTNTLTVTAPGTYDCRILSGTTWSYWSPRPVTITAGVTTQKGLQYKYYLGSWSSLPNFTTLTPTATGITPNISLAPATRTTQYAFYWQGSIKIPVSGTYTFRTNSDDGSRLYLNAPYVYNGSSLVNNDGLHSAQNADGTITLNAGTYPITITYFQQGGSAVMSVSWKTPQTNNQFTAIPDSVFTFTSSGSSAAQPLTAGIQNALSSPVKISTYPNPFTDQVVLKLKLKQDVPRLNVIISNLSGKMMYQQSFSDVPKGEWMQKLNFNGKSLKRGFYILEVSGIPGELPASVKIIK